MENCPACSLSQGGYFADMQTQNTSKNSAFRDNVLAVVLYTSVQRGCNDANIISPNCVCVRIVFDA